MLYHARSFRWLDALLQPEWRDARAGTPWAFGKRARRSGSGRRGGQRSGTNRPKGRTRDQLYAEAKKLGVKGRSTMNKEQLRRAVDAKK